MKLKGREEISKAETAYVSACADSIRESLFESDNEFVLYRDEENNPKIGEEEVNTLVLKDELIYALTDKDAVLFVTLPTKTIAEIMDCIQLTLDEI